MLAPIIVSEHGQQPEVKVQYVRRAEAGGKWEWLLTEFTPAGDRKLAHGFSRSHRQMQRDIQAALRSAGVATQPLKRKKRRRK